MRSEENFIVLWKEKKKKSWKNIYINTVFLLRSIYNFKL